MIKKNVWIIANWKSNKTISEALAWLDIVGPKLPKRDNLKIVVCPPFTDIEEVKKNVLVNNYPLLVGSQDLSPSDTKQYTGEEPAKILAELVDLSILGHSERRENFSETDEMVKEKVLEAQKYKITSLVCLQNEDTPVPEGTNMVAYEPVFAIGTGNPDTPENASIVGGKIKEKSGQLPILYGGSVTSENSESFLKQENIDGLLIGRASLNGEEFLKIIEKVSLS